jgi:1-hydroxy-2-methyl-2-(E)-butenyl 4-diphosphate synthase
MYPVRIQSMANVSTMDTDAAVAQAIRMIEAGAEYIRFATQGIREARNLGKIRQILREKGYQTPLVADVHFNPKAAEVAAKYVEKVRINPGNYIDKVKSFKQIDYTDEDYAKEILKIRERFIPFLELCRKYQTAVRIGVNHGSLSDRIMSRYGDTPEGMVESCMEFLRICKETAFENVVISIKTSNTVLMVRTVRLLAHTMQVEGMNYPLHLGVTEAGDEEDGRIKSAVGIGSLLVDGIGDTIRVSLSEPPEAEMPVARKLVDYTTSPPALSNPHPPSGTSPTRGRKRKKIVREGASLQATTMARICNPRPVICRQHTDYKSDRAEKVDYSIDCFVPRNDDTRRRHCEERSNPENNINFTEWQTHFKHLNELDFSRPVRSVMNIGGTNHPVVISDRRLGDFTIDPLNKPDYLYVGSADTLSLGEGGE